MWLKDIFKKTRPEAGALTEERVKVITSIDHNAKNALLARVGRGKENAFNATTHNQHNGSLARAMRAAVQEANQNGDIIINDMDGAGYYRPILTRPAEAAAAIRYLKTLEAQAKTINKTVDALSTAIIEGVSTW